MVLPNFLIIGAQKAGTTTLQRVLNLHPNIFMSKPKELNYFFFDKYYNKGLKWYKKHFKGYAGEQWVGEASPGYIVAENAPKRIKTDLGDVKIIITIRNPIDRAYSQYWDNRRSLIEKYNFEEAIKHSPITWRKGERGYLARGIYIRDIKRYLEYFERDQMLILLMDELISDPQNYFNKCFRFLDLAPIEVSNKNIRSNPPRIRNNNFYKFFLENPKYCKYIKIPLRSIIFRWGKLETWKYPPMDIETRKKLGEVFFNSNKELEGLLQEDLSHWMR